MSRGFTNEEKKIIRKDLINAFEQQLRVQKASKISVDDLVKEVGISKGSFYNFFPSKEVLFVNVINDLQSKIINEVTNVVATKSLSDKDKLKRILKLIIKRLLSNSWLQQLSGNEFEKLIRRLPQDMKDDLLENDVFDIQNILDKLNLRSVIPISKVVVIIQIILSSTTRSSDFGKQYNSSVKFMIDLFVENLFEEQERKKDEQN